MQFIFQIKKVKEYEELPKPFFRKSVYCAWAQDLGTEVSSGSS
jgi:hypothetical protein